MTEQEHLHSHEEPLSLPRQVVDMIMSTLQNGTAKEVAERNMADRLDISEVLPNVDTTNWCEEAQDYLKEIYRTCLSFDIDSLKGVYTIFRCQRYAVFTLYQITCAGFQIVFRYIVYHDIVLSGGFVLALINMHDTAEAFKFLSPIPLLAYFRRIA